MRYTSAQSTCLHFLCTVNPQQLQLTLLSLRSNITVCGPESPWIRNEMRELPMYTDRILPSRRYLSASASPLHAISTVVGSRTNKN